MKHKPRHALYLLPNAFTTGALFCGFYAILQAIEGDWQWAAWSVLAAAVLDACDGRVARLTGTSSAFGVEYDSLSDVVSFGVAPAILMFQWSLAGLERIGFAAVFCYCAATALRLARFNTQAVADRRFFIGLPSPAAAALLVSYVGCADKYGIAPPPVISFSLCMLMAVAMVSGLRFYSFKTINLRARRPLYNGLLLVVLIATLNVFAKDLLLLLLLLLLAYTTGCIGYAVWSLITRRSRR